MEKDSEDLQDRVMYAVVKTSEIETQQLQMTISRPVMKALGDLVLQYMEQLARELEMFAQHAGRKSVNMDDVLLSARRNPDVASKLLPLVQELTKTSKKDKDKDKDKQPRKKQNSKDMRKRQESDDAVDDPPRTETSKNGTRDVSNATEKRQKVITIE